MDFMDLSKAFSMLNHSLLLAKLNIYGFSLISTTFIHNYLNNKISALEDIYSGVSQDSVLGPLLSNISINDIFSFLTTYDIFTYADHYTLYIFIEEISTKFKNTWKNILKCEITGSMTIKCEFMGFGKTIENEVFGYHEIRHNETTTKKLLGITIDKHLNFNECMLQCWQKV